MHFSLRNMSANQSPASSPKSSTTKTIDPNAAALAGGSVIKPLAPHEPSLCIPRVFSNIKERRIRAIFRECGITEGDTGGIIDHIDFVEKTARDGSKFNRVFIHFKNGPNGFDELRRRLIDNHNQKDSSGKPTQNSFFKIIYDDPWFWTIFANFATKHSQTSRPAPKIVL